MIERIMNWLTDTFFWPVVRRLLVGDVLAA